MQVTTKNETLGLSLHSNFLQSLVLKISCQKSLSFPRLTSSFTFAEISDDDSARGGEGDEEGDRKEPLRFESLEVTSLEQSVPDHLIKTYDEVTLTKSHSDH